MASESTQSTQKLPAVALTAMVVGSMVGAEIFSLPRTFGNVIGRFGCRHRLNSLSARHTCWPGYSKHSSNPNPISMRALKTDRFRANLWDGGGARGASLLEQGRATKLATVFV